jgi:hypothetical protein
MIMLKDDEAKSKLFLITLLHTAIWLFYVLIILYTLYAAIMDRIDLYFLIAVCLVLLEGIILIKNGWRCPLTRIGGKYSSDVSIGFDIFLPKWLAKHNKTIFTLIFLASLILAIYRILN